MQVLSRHLRERSLLLVLDNLEQVLDAAPLIAEVLASAPGVKAISTSREPLQIAGETCPPANAPCGRRWIGVISWCLAALAGAHTLDEDLARGAMLCCAGEALREQVGCREADGLHL